MSNQNNTPTTPDDTGMLILTTTGGPCIYKRGILPDGTTTGRVQYTGQTPENLRAELLATTKTGRDDVREFVDRLFTPGWMP